MVIAVVLSLRTARAGEKVIIFFFACLSSVFSFQLEEKMKILRN